MLAQTVLRRRIRHVNKPVEKMVIRDVRFQLPSHQVTGVALLRVVRGLFLMSSCW